jgi:hypothetical protein
MSAALVAALLLSVAAYIHTRSAAPEMRPEHPAIDLLWRGLSIAALVMWGAMVVREFSESRWAEGAFALIGSILANMYISHRGPRPTWPALSMGFAVIGLGFAVWSLVKE